MTIRTVRTLSARIPTGILFLALVASPIGIAQTDAVEKQTLQLRPADALRSFNGPEEQAYTTGDGDELTVEVVGHPELSGKHVIGPDGIITAPVAGPIQAAGMTREGIAAAISAKLSEHFVNLIVTVRIDKYGSNRILLVGKVVNPGVLLFDRTPTLLEVLSRSGGVKQDDDKQTRDSIPARCAILRGTDKVLWLNIRDLLASGNPDVDLRLKRNDIVYVPADRDDIVTVLGEVRNPGVVTFDTRTSLQEAIAIAGGFGEGAGKTLHVIRPSTGMDRAIPMSQLVAGSTAIDIKFQRGDIIYVPKSGLAKFSHVAQALNPAGTMMLFAGTVLK